MSYDQLQLLNMRASPNLLMQLTQKKYRWNNKRDDYFSKSDYIPIYLIQYHTVFIGDRTI